MIYLINGRHGPSLINFYHDLIAATILNNYSNCQEIEAQGKPVSQRSVIGREVKGGIVITSCAAGTLKHCENNKAYLLGQPLSRHHCLVLPHLQFLKNSAQASVSHFCLREQNSPILLFYFQDLKFLFFIVCYTY